MVRPSNTYRPLQVAIVEVNRIEVIVTSSINSGYRDQKPHKVIPQDVIVDETDIQSLTMMVKT